VAFTVAMSQGAAAFDLKPYKADAFKAAQDASKPVVVDVYASWCPTCRAQKMVFDKLKDKPDYAAVTVFLVDFDNDAAALKAFGVNQQSTLIAFKGATETARSAGATKTEAIEALLTSTTK
jgi:thiol-disulfide isomerase/thioredoxin